jgi:hypothetical protein
MWEHIVIAGYGWQEKLSGLLIGIISEPDVTEHVPPSRPIGARVQRSENTAVYSVDSVRYTGGGSGQVAVSDR